MRRLALFAALAGWVSLAPAAPPTAPDAAAAKQALQKVGDLVGDWKGSGTAKRLVWSETLAVGWKFRGADTWLELAVTGGKFVSKGELRYDPAKKLYTLALTDAGKVTTNYDGSVVKDKLVLTAKDAKSGDVRRLTAYTVADGARMILKAETQAKGRGLFAEQFAVAATKAGESFAGGGAKPECLITGGLGTIPVSYNGKQYFVCCSGCRDEFAADPKKYADAFEKKK